MSATEHITGREGAATRHPLPLFPLGRIVATPGGLAALDEAKQSAEEFLRRHQRGDWGSELSDADKMENELSVSRGFRIRLFCPFEACDAPGRIHSASATGLRASTSSAQTCKGARVTFVAVVDPSQNRITANGRGATGATVT